MNIIWNDLKFALRQLRRSPALAITAILTLALGIGANTAIFSLLDQALLRSLPVRDPGSLVVLEGTGDAWEGHSSSYGGDAAAYFSYPMYRDLLAQGPAHGLQDLLATSHAEAALTSHSASQIADGEIVSGNYFEMLGTQAYRGRLLSRADDTVPGGDPVVVLAYNFWQNHLGGDPSIVGQTVSLNGHPYQVIGIASPNFHSAIWGETPAFFVPMSMLDQVLPGKGRRLTDHTDRWMNIIGRLNPGETRDQAQAALAPLWHALRADELKALGTRSPRFVREFLTDSRLLVLPGARGFSYSRDTLRTPLLVVMGMAILVLLIASVNVGSLLLVRSASRVREFSLRAALGAAQGRMLSQLLIEGLLLGILGGTMGLLLAPLVLHVLVLQLAGTDGSSAFSASLDPRVLLFNFAVAICVSLLFSMVPALQLRRINPTAALRESNSSATGSMLGLRRTVVCAQIGLSVMLLIVSGLLVRTMQKLRLFDVGFNASHLVEFSVSPQLNGYAPERILALAQTAEETLAYLPGVQSVATTDAAEFNGDSHGGSLTIEGYTPAPDEQMEVQKTYMNPGYLPGLQIPLLTGRNIGPEDDATHPHVVLVNEALAKRYFGSPAKALGKHIDEDHQTDRPVYDSEIVGVVPNYKLTGIRDAVEPTVFRPLRQASPKQMPNQLYFFVRTALPPTQTIETIRRTMRQIDPALALDNLRTMDEQIDDSLANDRLIELLALSFGGLASLLAGVGLYGVLAYSTAQRTREIGIRMALGSTRAAISRIVLADVLRLAGLGILVALPVAFGLSHLLRSQLFGVSPADPLSILFAVLLISAVAFIAALIPAVRAASINPTEALRTE